jgi:hypothetical protein
MNSRITVHLSGGLGNQLFQFMAGAGLAEATERKLVINTNFYKRPWIRNRHHIAYTMKRRLEIRAFHEAASTTRDRWLTLGDGRFERVLMHLPESTKRKFGVATEESFIEGEWIRPEEIQRLVGYFMSPKFFLHSKVGQRFQKLASPSNSWTTQMSERISTQKAIGIHLRMGDYLLQNNILVPTETYFLNAIDHLNSLLGSGAKSFLFTDEPMLVAKKFPTLATLVEIVKPPSNVSTAENLLLLSKCSGFVCSNSTFSWWGAHMSNVPSSLIVHPSVFYTSNRTAAASLDLWEADTISIDAETGQKAH